MPWPTNPSEEYFGRGLWGWAVNTWKRIVSTAGGALHVYVTGGDGAILVQQQQASLFTPGIHGYDGSAWQKLPMLWGYTDRVYEDLSESAPSTGTWTKLSAVVPAGEVHTLEFMYVINDTRAGASVAFAVVASGVVNYFVYTTTVARFFPNTFVGKITLKAGDRLRITMGSVTSGDVMKACVWGSKMEIA